MKRNNLIYIIASLVVITAVSLMLISRQPFNDESSEILSPTGEFDQKTEVMLPTEAAGNEETIAEITEPTAVGDSGLAPTPRAGLVGTDPSTVKLASGEIQLIEFFAFW